MDNFDSLAADRTVIAKHGEEKTGLLHDTVNNTSAEFRNVCDASQLLQCLIAPVRLIHGKMGIVLGSTSAQFRCQKMPGISTLR